MTENFNLEGEPQLLLAILAFIFTTTIIRKTQSRNTSFFMEHPIVEEQLEISPNAAAHSARKKDELWEIAKVVFFGLAIMLAIRYYIAQPFIVKGASMEPNFADGQYLVIDEASYYLRAPERGEVIVFHYPDSPSQYFIKRIIGLPGEEVTRHDGKIEIVNKENPQGFTLGEQYLDPRMGTYPDGTTMLAADQYFVLGDNRPASSDSRFWGALGKNFIVGRVLLRAWPFSNLGVISRGNINETSK